MKVKKLNGKSNVLGKNVKKYRELRHLTQRELSDKIALLGVDIYQDRHDFRCRSRKMC